MAVTIEAAPAIDARAQVERILQSKVFRTSEVLRHLFAYLIDKSLSGTADALKEYTIGLDALGKPSSYDPRQESVVRMHTARLRQKLAEYYRTEGVADPILVDLPKGGFKVTFEARQPIVPPLPVSIETGVLQRNWQRREIALAAGLAVALVCAVFAVAQLWRVERNGVTVAGLTPALRELWDPLLSSNRRLVVCV